MSKSWRRSRREAYLSAWPLPAQMEALMDAQSGNTTKLDKLQADFAAIRAQNPKPSSAVSATEVSVANADALRKRKSEVRKRRIIRKAETGDVAGAVKAIVKEKP